MKAFTFEGKLLWEIPCLATGQTASWWKEGGDTPPSVYRLGTLYNDKANGTMLPAYGWMFFDMVDCDVTRRESGENTNGRSGIGLHSGGSSLANPFAPFLVALVPTLGCLRIHNKHLETNILPLYNSGKVYISVFQDNL
jgi:hypothetical protein